MSRLTKYYANFLLVLVGIVMLVWLGEYLFRMIRFTFIEPERWLALYIVENAAIIKASTKAIYFTMWTAPVVFSLFAYWNGIKCLVLCRNGDIFNEEIVTHVMALGAYMMASMVFETLASSFNDTVLTLPNLRAALPPRFWFDAGNISIFLCGAAFLFVGLVVREGIRLREENERFV